MPSTYKTMGDRKGNGDPNILKLKDVNKVRPLDNVVAGWRQHAIEHPNDPEQFASVVCPGSRSCPLDRKPVDAEGKQRFPISRRFAANVWDYDTSSVKVLVAGPKVFDPFKEAATVGIDPASCDWTITKSGTGKKTDYTVIRHDASPFTATLVTPDMLHSVDKYEMPASTETVFEILEKFGIDYDALETPSYTLEEALKFVMPYTKHKGLTIEQLVSGELEYAQWMHSTKLDQGQLGDPVFLALQTVLEDRGLVQPLDETFIPPEDPEPQEPSQTSPSSSNMVELIGPDGKKVTVPPSVVDSMLAVGFTRPVPPATSVDANAPMQVIIGGNMVELPREQALMLIEAGTATAVPEETEPEPEPEPPKVPLPDEVVEVSINGTVVPMPFAQASAVVGNPASGATFVDSDVAEAHERVKTRVESAPDPSVTPPNASGSTAPVATATSSPDQDKPFACDQCDARYKSAGALTQHKNREHKAAEPQPSAIPTTTNGNGSLSERVKEKISHAPFAKDFTRLLTIFEEATGEKNFAQMNDEQLAKLEARLDIEVAASQ